MRKNYTEIVKSKLCAALFRERCERKMSQEEMAQRLNMSVRSYVDLEHGKSGCSALTLLFFLLNVCPEPMEFLCDIREAFESVEVGVR